MDAIVLGGSQCTRWLDRSSAIASFCGFCAEACKRFGYVSTSNVVTLAFAILTNDELGHQSSHDPIENEPLHMLVE